ncbi:TPA: hypothetical protein ACH3X1_009103 [Trebouxia sp. C0004]
MGGADAPSKVACAADRQPGLRCQWQTELCRTVHLPARDGTASSRRAQHVSCVGPSLAGVGRRDWAAGKVGAVRRLYGETVRLMLARRLSVAAGPKAGLSWSVPSCAQNHGNRSTPLRCPAAAPLEPGARRSPSRSRPSYVPGSDSSSAVGATISSVAERRKSGTIPP